MTIQTMYPAKAGSPKTQLASAITNSDTSMTIVDANVLPAAPNICVIGDDSNAEVVLYSGISGNTVTGLVRAVSGSGTMASSWPSGTTVARYFTSYDHYLFMQNINDLSTNKQDNLTFDTTPTPNSLNPVTSNGVAAAIASAVAPKAPLASPEFTGTPTAPTPTEGDSSTKIATTAFVQEELGDYAPLASPAFTGTPTAPTATTGDSSTKIATTAFVQEELGDYAPLASPALTGTPTAPTAVTSTNTDQLATCAFVKNNGLFYGQGTLTRGTTATFSNAAITSSMLLINIELYSPEFVSSRIDWTTSNGSITFTGTFTSSCNIKFVLGTPKSMTFS